MAKFTKATIKKNIRRMTGDTARKILETIALDIRVSRELLNSSEILDGVCNVLRENGLDE